MTNAESMVITFVYKAPDHIVGISTPVAYHTDAQNGTNIPPNFDFIQAIRAGCSFAYFDLQGSTEQDRPTTSTTPVCMIKKEDLTPTLSDNERCLKVKLVDISHSFLFAPVRQRCCLISEHYQEINNLKWMAEMKFSKPDKDSDSYIDQRCLQVQNESDADE